MQVYSTLSKSILLPTYYYNYTFLQSSMALRLHKYILIFVMKQTQKVWCWNGKWKSWERESKGSERQQLVYFSPFDKKFSLLTYTVYMTCNAPWGEILLHRDKKLSSGQLEPPIGHQFVFVFRRNGDEKFNFQTKSSKDF